MRFSRLMASAILAITTRAHAQASDSPAAATMPDALASGAESLDAPEWEFSLTGYACIIDDDDDYIQTTFTADYDWLHLEARHQYEDLDTGSLWLGYNLSFGGEAEDDLTIDVTPMIGAVFGDTDGFAPGYEITLTWRQIELYTEGEFVFDSNEPDDDFFYSWSELTYSFTDWLRAGIAAQRTRVRHEDADIEVGPLLGLSWQNLDLSAYLLYPDEGDPTFILGVGLSF